jgi:hypothetical protein
MLLPIFSRPIELTIGNKRFVSYPPLKRTPIEAQAEQLIRQGYKTIIFYGTSGGVMKAPVETLVIPKTMYFYPENSYRIIAEKYVPLPVENILLDSSANNLFNTDNFYKTDHIFVSGTYQERESFLTRVLEHFQSSDGVSVDMDLAPLAKVCFENNIALGAILYNTDVLKGAHQALEKKGYNMRQMILLFLRAYDSNTLLVNGTPIEELVSGQFETCMKSVIHKLLGNQSVKAIDKRSNVIRKAA